MNLSYHLFFILILKTREIDFGCFFMIRSNKVLVLEAGPKDTILGSTLLQWKIHMPAALMYNLCDDKYNW